MKKVIFYTDSDFFSGAERVLMDVASGVAADKLIVLNPLARERAAILYPNVPVEYKASRSKLAFHLIFRFRKIIKDFAPDVCFVNMQTPFANTLFLLACRLSGVRVVTAWHFPQRKGELKYPTRPLKLLAYKLAIGWSSKIITVSKAHRESLVNEFGAPAEKVVAIANGVVDVAGTITRDFDHQTLHLLAVGTLEGRKNQLWLLKRLAALAGDWDLTLVSNGPDKPLIEAYLKDNNLEDRVHLAGHQMNVDPYYRAADLLVHPAIAENMSIVMLEALEYGLPVICNNVGGNSELASQDENGWLLECDDEVAWTKALKTALNDRGVLQKFSKAARSKYLEKFTLSTTIRNYQVVIDEEN